MSLDTGWSDAEGARRVTTAFRARFGTEPDGVWSAPGRVNLIGEHTDYNGGLCLPLALPHRTYLALARTDDDTVELASVGMPDWTGHPDDVRPGGVTGWAAYPAGVLWALGADHGLPPLGLRGMFDSCVPMGSGLSSSAAIQCSTAVAIDELAGLGLADHEDGRVALVAACIRGENEVAGARTGGMDQSASLLASAGHAVLLDMRDGTHRQVPFAPGEHGLALLVVDTRTTHTHAGGEYAHRRAECEAAARALGIETLREVEPAALDDALAAIEGDVPLADGSTAPAEQVRRRVRHVVTEIARVEAFVAALEAGDIDALGPLMVASHESLRDDYEVSCRELDLAVHAALDAGARGARMTGGGFGGCAIVLVPIEAVATVIDGVEAAFHAAGLAAPGFLDGTASAAASGAATGSQVTSPDGARGQA